jgi:hypothetical protein
VTDDEILHQFDGIRVLASYASQNNLFDLYKQGGHGYNKEHLDKLEQLGAEAIRSAPSGYSGNTCARRVSVRKLPTRRVGTDFASSEIVRRQESRQVSFDIPNEDSPKESNPTDSPKILSREVSLEVSPDVSPDVSPKENL